MGFKGLTKNTAPEAEPHIYAEDDAAIYQAIAGEDGVFSIGQQFAATVMSNNKVRIADGVAIIGGHIGRTAYGEYDDMEIVNGQSGYNRNDIIVGKFVTTGTGGIDEMTLEVKQGTAATTATDPALTQDDIYQAGKIRELPLYRVRIEGLSIVAVEQMFEVIPTIPMLLERLVDAQSKIAELNSDKSNLLAVNGFNISNVSFSSGCASGESNIAKDGYTPLGIVGFDMLTSYVSPTQLRIEGSNLQWSIRKHYEDSFSGTGTSGGLINVKILYLKNS